jgi:aspartate kinase
VIVVKFGGTSLAGTERMRAAARIVAVHRRDQSVVCVVSAMAGVTDALIRTIELATRGETAWQATVAEIRIRHQDAMNELTRTTGAIPAITSRFATACAALEADLRRVIAAPCATDEAHAHAIAAFSGWGEQLAVLLFAHALEGEGVAAAPFEGEPVVMVERQGLAGTAHMGAQSPQGAGVPLGLLAPSVAATRGLLVQRLAGPLQTGVVPVLPGYLACTRDGQVTTLGRNGSDYSAAVIGAALHAEAVYLYGTVAGMHRADPQVVPEAGVLPALTYADAAEAAALGARVLHPATLRPLAAAGIPLHLRSTLSPQKPGTDVGPARRSPVVPSERAGWVVSAHTLPPDRPLCDARPDWEPGLVEVTGLFFRHAEWEAHEDDHLTAEEPFVTCSNSPGWRGDSPASEALALLTAPSPPVTLAVSARRISVTVPAAESIATQRRLYAALAHADAR